MRLLLVRSSSSALSPRSIPCKPLFKRLDQRNQAAPVYGAPYHRHIRRRTAPAVYTATMNVRSGSKADIAVHSCDVLFTPESGHGSARGIEVIHTPGHCAGHVALLWRPGRMLLARDVCTNLMGLGDPVGFESLEEGRASQRKLAGLSFDAAGFGHGKPIDRDASAQFRYKWGQKLAA